MYPLICTHHLCISEGALSSDKVSVVIELEDRVGVEELRMTELLVMISTICQIDPSVMTIGWQNDELSGGIRVVVYVNDEGTANVIANAVSGIYKGEGCQYGLLCSAKDVHITGATHTLSRACRRGFNLQGVIVSIAVASALTVMILSK